ncbi:MAG: hypothetical protein DIJKHBIC_04801 [Thermoanaerobaculia bacterium]|nr:hypothetical protein [Thermoanaerobaculia bacterium]
MGLPGSANPPGERNPHDPLHGRAGRAARNPALGGGRHGGEPLHGGTGVGSHGDVCERSHDGPGDDGCQRHLQLRVGTRGRLLRDGGGAGICREQYLGVHGSRQPGERPLLRHGLLARDGARQRLDHVSHGGSGPHIPDADLRDSDPRPDGRHAPAGLAVGLGREPDGGDAGLRG